LPSIQFTPIPEKLKDFRVFLCLVWQSLGLPKPTPVQLSIASYFQHGPRRKGIEAFRGVGKSWIAAAYVVWRLRCDPNLKFMVLSASKDRADNFTTFCLRLINEIPILQCLMPRADQRCSKLSFDVGPCKADHAPSVVSKGIFSQITGGRADEIIADDIEIPNNSYTQMMREKLSEAVKEFDAILKPNGIITYLGTPQTEQSLYNTLPDRGYEFAIWPARYPDENQQKNYGSSLSPFIIERMKRLGEGCIGCSTDPLRFSDEDLMERELSYGRSGFQLQFMLDTRLSDADRYPLKLHDLIVMGTNPESAPEHPVWAASQNNIINDLPCVGLNGDHYYSPVMLKGDWIPYTGAVMAIDPSGRGTDETAVVVAKMLNGFIYITAIAAFRDGYGDNTLRAIAEMAKAQKVNHVIIEANFGDGMFSKLLQPWFMKVEYPCLLEEVKHSKQKEARIIDTLEPVLNQHKLVIDRSVIEYDYNSTKNLPPEQAFKYQLFYQMSRLTRERGSLGHDDRLDCLAMAVGYWVESMAQDVKKRMMVRREELLQEELKLWESDKSVHMTKLLISSGIDGLSDMGFSFQGYSKPVKIPKSGLSHPVGRAGGLLSRFR